MNRPLRVLRVIARLNVGGPAVHVGMLTSRLDATRFDTVLAVGRPGAGEGDMFVLRPELAAGSGGRVVRVAGLGRDVRLGGDLLAVLHLTWLIRRVRPDIVHTHTAKAGALARPLARLLRVPVIVHTFHGTVFDGHFRRPVARAVAVVERILGSITSAVVAVSPSVAADLERARVAAGKVRVIPLGLDLEPFLRVPPLAAGSPPPGVVALLARLVPVKDVPFFFDVARRVHDKRPDVRFVVAGDGPLGAELRRAAPSCVEMLGHQGDVAALLGTCGAVVLTSRSEGSPVSLIEALAAARPVVATEIGGVRDVLDGRPGARLVHVRDPDAFATTLLEVLDDDRIAAEVAGGRAAVAADYGADRLVRDMESLYDELWRRV